MESEEADQSLNSVGLTEGEAENCELSPDEDICEGAVGFSPTQDNWMLYVLNEPTYIEENEENPGNFSWPSSCDNAVQMLRERSIHSQRRHSLGSLPVRCRSPHILSESNSFSCRNSLSQQMPVLSVTSENGMVRRESAPSFPTDRPKRLDVRRTSLQMEQPLRCQQGRGLSLRSSSPTVHQVSRLSPSNDIPCVGSDLFLMFLRDEIERSEVHSLPQEDLPQVSRGLLENGEFMEMGTHLRYMADEFAKSDQRERVRERAANVNLSTLDFNSFSDLLFGMFQQGGMTSERVLVLFTFCTDLAIRALREKLQARFYELTRWSQQYIMSWLSPWVQHHGGWAVVFERSVNEVYKVAVIGMCFMGMVALWIYIRNNCH